MMSPRRAARPRRIVALLPQGTAAIGVGVAIYGLTAYGFLVIAARSLGPSRYASLSALWAVIYVVGPGVFLPVEQEMNRVIASHGPLDHERGRLLHRAFLIAGLISAVLVATSLSLGREALIEVFDGDVLLLVALILGLVGYGLQHVVRGMLSGTRQFGHYAAVLITEGALRLIACLIIAAVGVSTAGPYGVIIGVAPFLSILPGWSAARAVWRRGAATRWRELRTAIGYLVLSALCAQFLAAAEPLIVKVLAPPGREAAAGRFLASLVIARVPVFLFQAVQPPLLSQLSRLAKDDRLQDFRSALVRTSLATITIGAVTVLTMVGLGPWTVTALFGEGFALARSNLIILGGGTAAYLLAIAWGQGLIALSRHRMLALAWAAGSAAFVIRTALGSDIVSRVAQAFLVGSAVSALTMGLALVATLRMGGPSDSQLVAPAATET